MSVPLSMSPMSAVNLEYANLRPVWWMLFLLGLVSVVVGFLAIGSTVIATLASVVYFGVLLLIAGLTEVIHSIMVRNWRGFALHLLAAAIYLLVGLFMLEHPGRAAAVLTLLFAASFLVGGVLRIVFALTLKFPTWPWLLITGVVDVVLGALIWSEWPASSLWVIGLFVGIDLIFHGWAWMMMALNVRTYNAGAAA